MWLLIANNNVNYAKNIKNQYNRFPFERVEDACPLPGAGQNRPLPLLLPHTFRLRTISSWWSLPHMEKW